MKCNIGFLALLTLVAAAFTGCKNEDVNEHHFDNQFYLSSAIVTDDLLIKNDVESYTKMIESRLAVPSSSDVTVTLTAKPEMAAAYNMIYYDKAVALPAENYELVNKSIKIGAGSVTGEAVEVLFKNINELDKKTRYVLPVTVEQCDGIGVMDSRRTVYFVVRGAALINVVANIAEMYFPINWSAAAKSLVTGMKTITVEALLRSADWTAGRGNALSTVFGVEGHFLVRIGDADRPRDQLQLVTPNGNWPGKNEAPALPVNEWIHIALVFDTTTGEFIYYQNGVVVKSGTGASKMVTLDGTSNGCYIGKAWDSERWLPGEISELRVWNIQRTAQQIAANPYEVDPTTPGLVAYWKFDEGTGNLITDYANGTNLTGSSTPTWVPVEIPAIH